MLLSALLEQVNELDDERLDCGIWLADPDVVEGDDVDVYLASIAEVRVDTARNEVTLIPACETEPVETNNPIVCFRDLLKQLPSNTVIWGDFEIKGELPLNRDGSVRVLKTVASVAGFHFGPESEEAWLLMRPASEFAAGMLPT